MTDQVEHQGLMTVQQAAAYLAVSERTVWNLIKDNRLPAVRFGKKLLRIVQTDLDVFIQAAKGARR